MVIPSVLTVLVLSAGVAEQPQDVQSSNTKSAATSPASAPVESAEEAKPLFRSLHGFEVRAAKLLQKMIYDRVELVGPQREAVDLVFAAFVRDTAENRPKAILLAYRAEDVVATDGSVFKPDGDNAKDFAEGKIDKSRPFLVDQILSAAGPVHAEAIQKVVARWNKLRQQKMIDGPIMRLQRGVTDPVIAISPELRQQLEAKAQAMLEAIPRPERRPPFAAKYEPEIRAAIMAMLDENAAKQLKATMELLDSDAAEWDEPGRLSFYYDEARRVLGLPAATTPGGTKPSPEATTASPAKP